MPTLPFHRRQLQRTVWVTLFAWVLALLAGMVNACQVQPHRVGTPESLVSTRGHHAEHRHGTSLAEHDGPASDPGKTGCLKFCDDESSTVTKGLAAQPDLPSAVIMANVDWRASICIATTATRRSAERPASQGPPLVIRFLRLTI